MNNKLLLGIVVLLIIVGWIVLLGNKKSARITTTERTKQTQQPSLTGVMEDKSQGPTVTLGAADFSPKNLTVKIGTKVTWVNKSGVVATVNSAVHPTHFVYPPLNLGEFSNGQSVSLVFDKIGTYSYHNHLNPSQNGTITVK